eukprot:CAMPEP_0174265586 /NCGR_PEP_ID=MMETSP0439-20130205/27079_1 /TAXON_ID=0 /ORGANISM="Stereomyxa ramosa, Strain Chinc5" /LENGTH=319 /DNA_ID=CAMNT_0015352121 /DNA_START=30 /DNA_END=989 /DNA_ORIENTATION=-
MKHNKVLRCVRAKRLWVLCSVGVLLFVFFNFNTYFWAVPSKVDDFRCFSEDNFELGEKILGCEEIEKYVQVSDIHIGGGHVKTIYLGCLQNKPVVVNIKRNVTGKLGGFRFVNGIDLIRRYQGSENVVKLIGVCPKTETTITELLAGPLAPKGLGGVGDWSKFRHLPFAERFKIARGVAKSIDDLHNMIPGTQSILCDWGTDQFLISKDNVPKLNDFDGVYVLENRSSTVECTYKRFTNWFGLFPHIAPEQSDPGRMGLNYDSYKLGQLILKPLLHSPPSHIANTVNTLISKCTKRKPENRLSAEEIVKRMDNIYLDLV